MRKRAVDAVLLHEAGRAIRTPRRGLYVSEINVLDAFGRDVLAPPIVRRPQDSL
jgi:hypothetical protein